MEKLICTERLRTPTEQIETVLSNTQSDRARLLYSAPFRRLQQKAQVFSLETNSAVRSRLTHSIEVSHIGRYIVESIIGLIGSNEELKNGEYWRDNYLAISNIVETACLMHDIGNPPFGHFGEAAISQWFTSERCEKIIKNAFPSDKDLIDLKKKIDISDFEYFDGNPQGLRIISKLQGDDGKYGYNMICTQLASFLKYVYAPDDIKKFRSEIPLDSQPAFSKKIGFFSTEREMINSVWNAHEMVCNSRHPLAYLMEAADDISYCISDIEDGIEKGLISEEFFLQYMHKKLLGLRDEDNLIACELLSELVGKGDAIPSFLPLKTKLSRCLVKFVSSEFITNYDSIMECKYEREILNKETDGYKVLELLRNFTSKHIFSAREVESIELAGYSAIFGLLEIFSKLLVLDASKFKLLCDGMNKEIKSNNLQMESRLYNLLPGRYVKLYKNSLLDVNACSYKEWNRRAHLIVDYISGMTDNFAIETFQMLKGIKIV